MKTAVIKKQQVNFDKYMLQSEICMINHENCHYNMIWRFMDKTHRTLTATGEQKYNLRKAASFLFLSKRLELTATSQSKDQTQNPYKLYEQQRKSNDFSS